MGRIDSVGRNNIVLFQSRLTISFFLAKIKTKLRNYDQQSYVSLISGNKYILIIYEILLFNF